MSRLQESAQKGLGLLLMLAALAFAAAKAPERSLESLVTRWAPPPSDFIELDGQLLHLRDEGPRSDTLPLVLLHGTGASLHTWEGWAAALSRSRRVISLDLPGAGLSGADAKDDYHVAHQVALLARLLDHLHLGRVLLAGQGRGGELAWRLAQAQPARVAGLVLVASPLLAAPPGIRPLALQLADTPGLRQLGRWVLPRRLVEDTLVSLYGDPARLQADTVDRTYELLLRDGNRVAMLHQQDQTPAPATPAELAAPRAPMLILWGEQDRLTPAAEAQALQRALPGSELRLLPGLGHLPQQEDPAATLAALQPWLARITREAAGPQESLTTTSR